MKQSKKNISPETQQEALMVAKSTQKPGQTKEQTKLIAQGIEKGIALYKKQHKEKLREADKLRKKQAKKPIDQPHDSTIEPVNTEKKTTSSSLLPWGLLVISWAIFAYYYWTQVN